VDQERIIALLQTQNLFPTLIGCVRGGFDDFDTHVAIAVRPSVEGARAKFVNLRMLERLRMEFGEDGSPRMIGVDDLAYLLVEGDEFDVGVRVKKLNRHNLSYNHRSGQQDRLRRGQQFFNVGKPTAHVFLGYRMRGGLEPALTRVSISSEYEGENGSWYLDWLYPLWNEAEGLPLIQPIQPNLFPPTAPIVVPKLPGADVGDTAQEGG
jgi:hypothetical protein